MNEEPLPIPEGMLWNDSTASQESILKAMTHFNFVCGHNYPSVDLWLNAIDVKHRNEFIRTSHQPPHEVTP